VGRALGSDDPLLDREMELPASGFGKPRGKMVPESLTFMRRRGCRVVDGAERSQVARWSPRKPRAAYKTQKWGKPGLVPGCRLLRHSGPSGGSCVNDLRQLDQRYCSHKFWVLRKAGRPRSN